MTNIKIQSKLTEADTEAVLEKAVSSMVAIREGKEFKDHSLKIVKKRMDNLREAIISHMVDEVSKLISESGDENDSK